MFARCFRLVPAEKRIVIFFFSLRTPIRFKPFWNIFFFIYKLHGTCKAARFIEMCLSGIKNKFFEVRFKQPRIKAFPRCLSFYFLRLLFISVNCSEQTEPEIRIKEVEFIGLKDTRETSQRQLDRNIFARTTYFHLRVQYNQIKRKMISFRLIYDIYRLLRCTV